MGQTCLQGESKIPIGQSVNEKSYLHTTSPLPSGKGLVVNFGISYNKLAIENYYHRKVMASLALSATTDWPIDDLNFRLSGLDTRFFDLSVPSAPIAASHYTLWLIYEGAGTVMADGQRIPLRKSHCILFPPGTGIAFETCPEQLLHVYMLTFEVHSCDGSDLKDDALAFAGCRTVPVHPLSSFVAMLDSLNQYKNSRTGLDKFKRSILLQEVLFTFLTVACSEQSVTSREAVEKTIAYINEHYDRNLKLSELSVMACIGERQYSHLFKQVTGTSPMDYLCRVRIENAKKLLRASPKDMLSIANRVGFRDEFYFSRRFKQLVGVSPMAYVKNRQPRVIGLLYTSHLLALGIKPIGGTGLSPLSERIRAPLFIRYPIVQVVPLRYGSRSHAGARPHTRV